MFKHAALFLLICFSMPSQAENVWKVTSLDWPPFSGEKLPDGGSAIKTLREALKTQGITLEVEFYPWSRAIATAREPGYAGFFPAWPEDSDSAGGFTKSKTLFYSPLIIAINKEAAISVASLKDLTGKKIAIVKDYGNTAEFNAMVDSGAIKADVGNDDVTGLRKLDIKRVDGMLIDINVMRYVLHTSLPQAVAKIDAAPGWVEKKDLLLAVNDANPHKAAILQSMEKAVAAVDGQKIVDATNLAIFSNVK